VEGEEGDGTAEVQALGGMSGDYAQVKMLEA